MFVTEYLRRSFELLEVLQSAAVPVPARSIAELLGVNERSIRRHISALKEVGFGIDSVPGPHGGYQLGPGRRVAPLLPTETEVVALLAGLSSSAAMSLQPSAIDRDLLITKLSRLLPAKHKRAVDDINRYVASYQAAVPGTSATTIRELAKYCRLRLQLEVTYNARGQSQPTQLYEPHQVIQNDYLWYLVAWNPHEGEWRTLRIDRIAAYLPGKHHFVPRQPPGSDMAQYTANSIATAPYAFRVEAVFHAPASEVATLFPIDAVFIEPLDENSCVVHTGADTYETVAVYLLSANLPFFIRSPEEMRKKMNESAHRLRVAANIATVDAGLQETSRGQAGER